MWSNELLIEVNIKNLKPIYSQENNIDTFKNTHTEEAIWWKVKRNIF